MPGKQLRMSRVFDAASGNALIVAYSHGILSGPGPGLCTAEEYRANVAVFAAGGATGLMITPGYLRLCADLLQGPGKPAVILSLSWTNVWRGPELLGFDGYKSAHTLIASIEDAVRMGADMVHLYTFGGSADPDRDAQEMHRLGQVVGACGRYGLPVMCEPLALGTAVPPGASARKEYVALMARLAAEAGADLVKVEYTGDAASFAEVVAGCAVPVVMMGGSKTDLGQFLIMLEQALSAGARGVALGRNLFLHPNPPLAMEAVRRVVRLREPANRVAGELGL